VENQILEWKESWRDEYMKTICAFANASGGTTQELTGNALDEFILRKQGKTWNGVPVPHAAFREAITIENITNACKTAGKREPTSEFKRGREFSVTFCSDGGITANITTNAAVNETQKRIVAIMSVSPNITAKAIADELGIAERNVKNHSKALKDAFCQGSNL